MKTDKTECKARADELNKKLKFDMIFIKQLVCRGKNKGDGR